MAGLILLLPVVAAPGFLEDQRVYPRFRTAEKNCAELVAALFSAKGLAARRSDVFIRVFKEEAAVELWARSGSTDTFALVRTYEICASSGRLGPKRRQGDGQVPEGVYRVSGFNPTSAFHMSLRLNYPNASDAVLGEKGQLGGDIFIHGNCVTIGCVPIQDEFIEQLYLVCVYARDRGQKEIPVHVFPTRMDQTGMAMLRRASRDTTLQGFWSDLRQVYDAFERTHRVPTVTVGRDGSYRVVERQATPVNHDSAGH
jgi:murein L,D-transpeptidase YafK